MSRRGRVSGLAAVVVLALVSLGLTAPAHAATAPWAPKTPRLSTPWTSQVGPHNALPEYPRPQLTRREWRNLNGVWQFAAGTQGEAPPFGRDLGRSILVPYPEESALSGIGEHHDYAWYRRTFTVPGAWHGRHVQLNFGAVDYRATVYVNGHQVGAHAGGYTGFSYDITPDLRAGANELVVGVEDPTDAGGQAIGKQRNHPSGIWYTANSGIWQTVWLEPTAAGHVTRLDTDTTPDEHSLDVTAQTAGAGPGSSVGVEVLTREGKVAGTARGAPGAAVRVPVPNPHLWWPSDPYLYRLRVTLYDGSGHAVDTVGGYAGMRTITTGKVNGVLRPLLNGKFVFQLGPLDQGYWPDGIYTAPTDTALRYDIDQTKRLGFNTIRKHMKVEPARWYYWADRLGVLVWQDMPASNPDHARTAEEKAQFERELHDMIDQHRADPSIVQWTPFNEGWGQYDQARIADDVKAADPSRLVDNMSGINCCGAVDGGNGDVADFHIYVGPGSPTPTDTRVAYLGEYGGLGLKLPDHQWDPAQGQAYEMEPDAATLTRRYVELAGKVKDLIADPGLSAAIYTQTTDVENEVNGLMTYDRKVVKPDPAQVRTANQAILDAAR